jgi:hypothetical protein
MLDNKLYVLGHKLALKFFKGNTFMAEEALQNSMVNCHKNNNWHKPFVMQCIYNECRLLASRGYYKHITEKRFHLHTFTISEEGQEGFLQVSEEDFMEEHKRSIEDLMYASNTIAKVYRFLSKKQQFAFNGYMHTNDLIDGAKFCGMQYQTYKTHVRCILGIFKYYAQYGECPKNTSHALQEYKPYQNYLKNKRPKGLTYKKRGTNEEASSVHVR